MTTSRNKKMLLLFMMCPTGKYHFRSFIFNPFNGIIHSSLKMNCVMRIISSFFFKRQAPFKIAFKFSFGAVYSDFFAFKCYTQQIEKNFPLYLSHNDVYVHIYTPFTHTYIRNAPSTEYTFMCKIDVGYNERP